jgi:hypothetical protein
MAMVITADPLTVHWMAEPRSLTACGHVWHMAARVEAEVGGVVQPQVIAG